MKTNTRCLFTSAVQAATRFLQKNVRNAGVVVWAAGMIVLGLAATSAQAGIIFDGYKAWDKNSVSPANVYDASGSDKLVVAVAGEHHFSGNTSGNVTGITYNGKTLTKVVEENPASSANQTTADIWYLDNPGAYVGTGTIVVSFNGNNWVATAIGLSGTAPGFGATAHVTGAAFVGLTTTAANSLVIAVLGSGGGGNTALLVDGNAPLTTIEKHKISTYAGIATAYAAMPLPSAQIFSFNTTAIDVVTLAAEFLDAVPAGAHWDINGSTAGAGGTTPAAIWDAGNTYWNPGAAGTNAPAVWTPGQVAVFAAGTDATGTYTVTVDNTQDIAGLTFQEGTVTLASGTAGALRLTSTAMANVASGRTATVAVPISDDGGVRQLYKVGPGMLVLSGDNSYTGATSVVQGTLSLSGNNVAAVGGMALNGGLTHFESPAAMNGTGENITLNAGATVLFGTSFGAGNLPSALDRIVTTSTGVIAADNYAGTAFDFNTPGLTGTYLGATGSVTYTGTLTPNSGNYRLGGGGGTLTLTVPNMVSGSGSTLAIGGNLNLTVANDHTGGTTLNAGALILGDAGALGSGTFTLASAGPLQAAGIIATANQVAVNSDFTVSGTGSLTLGALTLNASRSITLSTTAGTTTFGAISGANRALTFSGNGNASITGVIATGTGALTKNGAGTLTLSNASSTYTGVTTINGGTLSVSKLANGGADSSIGRSTSADTSLVLGNGTTLKYTGAGDTTDRQFKINGTAAGNGATLDASGSGPVLFMSTTSPTYGTAAQTRTLNLIGSNTSTNTLAANIANNGTGGALNVIKDGTGTWVISGTCAYTGTTLVKAGALLGMAGGACASSAVTVTNTPGNLSALGVTVADNSKQWTCASLAFTTSGPGAELQFHFAVEPSTTQAPLSITGNLAFNGAPVVVVDPANLKTGRNYPLLVVGGTAPSVVPELSLPGLKSSLSWGGDNNKTLYLNLPPGGTRLLLY